jgi:hypothetical protein
MGTTGCQQFLNISLVMRSIGSFEQLLVNNLCLSCVDHTGIDLSSRLDGGLSSWGPLIGLLRDQKMVTPLIKYSLELRRDFTGTMAFTHGASCGQG